MGAFLYGISLQWRLDLRSRTLLITCYIVPLLFFAVMGGIFTSVMPGAGETLIQSMTVFGVTMGALIGLPPSLVEIYGGDIKKVYRANGVPLWLGLALTNLSAFLHLLLMSGILYIAAPLAFRAVLPEDSVRYFLCLALFLAVSLGVASVIGLAVKDQAKTSVVSIAVFLPSILLWHHVPGGAAPGRAGDGRTGIPRRLGLPAPVGSGLPGGGPAAAVGDAPPRRRPVRRFAAPGGRIAVPDQKRPRPIRPSPS